MRRRRRNTSLIKVFCFMLEVAVVTAAFNKLFDGLIRDTRKDDYDGNDF